MTTPRSQLRRPHRSIVRRSAFTFTEVLFAVIILGIGFIMLAAIFPVAIQQTKASHQDSMAAATARSALRYMEDLGQQKTGGLSLMTQTGGVVTPILYGSALWNAVSGNMIIPNDPRFAWVPLYSRAANSPFAQVFIFVEQVQGDRTKFESTVDLAAPTPNLQARAATVTLTYSAAGSTITFTAGGNSVAEGSYVVIASGNDAGGKSAAGRIYRVGTLASGTTWYLAPEYGLKDDGTQNIATAASAYVVGKFSTDGGNTATGLSQDIGCYTSFVRVN